MDTITMLRMGKLLPAALCRLMENTMVFSSNGRMYADTIFDNEGKRVLCKKRMEVFCENEWCYEWRYVHGWMYCGSDRTYYKDGIYEINNTLYLF